MRAHRAAVLAAVASVLTVTPGSAQGFLNKLAGRAKASIAAERDSLRAHGQAMKGQARAALNAERDTAQAYMNGLASDAERKADSLVGGATAVAGPAASADTGAGRNDSAPQPGANASVAHGRRAGAAAHPAARGQSPSGSPPAARAPSRTSARAAHKG